MKRSLLFSLLAVLVTPASCSDDDAPWKNVEPGGCGLTGNTWLRPERVGRLVSFDGGSPLSGADLDDILGDVPPAPSPLPYGARVFYVRYTSQDKGREVEATGMIGLPWHGDGVQGPFPMVT